MLQVRTFRHLLVEAAARFGDQQFLIEDHALGTVSYAEVFRFAGGLRHSSTNAESRSALLLLPCFTTVESLPFYSSQHSPIVTY